MAASSFNILIAGISFSPLSVAVLASFVLLIGFGLVVKGGQAVLLALGLDDHSKMQAAMDRMSDEDFAHFKKQVDIEERLDRRRQWKKDGLL